MCDMCRVTHLIRSMPRGIQPIIERKLPILPNHIAFNDCVIRFVIISATFAQPPDSPSAQVSNERLKARPALRQPTPAFAAAYCSCLAARPPLREDPPQV
jgi:hypothetical protein